jgi:hypothetical protein
VDEVHDGDRERMRPHLHLFSPLIHADEKCTGCSGSKHQGFQRVTAKTSQKVRAPAERESHFPRPCCPALAFHPSDLPASDLPAFDLPAFDLPAF